jgi:hypothetical protein
MVAWGTACDGHGMGASEAKLRGARHTTIDLFDFVRSVA